MIRHTYGVTSQQTGYFDVSRTLLGAKQWATRNGYNEVYIFGLMAGITRPYGLRK